MHQNSIDIMKALIAAYGPPKDTWITVVDYGSMEVPEGPGTYRSLIPESWQYLGVDIAPGPNVDHVMAGEYDTGLPSDFADLVISGQCLEHVRNPFAAVAEMGRILKPGGLLFLIAPFAWECHRFPLDCFRFAPDGMRALMEASGLTYKIGNLSDPLGTGQRVDCYAVGVKPW